MFGYLTKLPASSSAGDQASFESTGRVITGLWVGAAAESAWTDVLLDAELSGRGIDSIKLVNRVPLQLLADVCAGNGLGTDPTLGYELQDIDTDDGGSDSDNVRAAGFTLPIGTLVAKSGDTVRGYLEAANATASNEEVQVGWESQVQSTQSSLLRYRVVDDTEATSSDPLAIYAVKPGATGVGIESTTDANVAFTVQAGASEYGFGFKTAFYRGMQSKVRPPRFAVPVYKESGLTPGQPVTVSMSGDSTSGWKFLIVEHAQLPIHRVTADGAHLVEAIAAHAKGLEPEKAKSLRRTGRLAPRAVIAAMQQTRRAKLAKLFR